MSVPNQKIISEFIYEPCDKDNPYAMVNIEALYAAMSSLDKIYSLKLWLYLSKNARNYRHFELSQVECAEWGIPRSSYYKAVEDLMEKNYLVPSGDSGKFFTFYQVPVSSGDWENSGKSPVETKKSPVETEQSPVETKQSPVEQRKNTQNTQNTGNYMGIFSQPENGREMESPVETEEEEDLYARFLRESGFGGV